jgi:hypothetical protein
MSFCYFNVWSDMIRAHLDAAYELVNHIHPIFDIEKTTPYIQVSEMRLQRLMDRAGPILSTQNVGTCLGQP